MWGATDVYDMMQKTSDDVITRQVMNWESLMRSAYLKLKGKPEEDTPIALFPTLKQRDSEADRDFGRRVFRESLRSDMLQILNARGTKFNPDSVKMPWLNWANEAFKKKYCLVHYPVSAFKPGPGFDLYKPSQGIEYKDIEQSNVNRKHGIGGFVRIISWTEEDMELELDDPSLADVALCMNREGRPVIRVSDSDNYLNKMAGRDTTKSAQRKRNNRGDEEQDETGDEEDPPLIRAEKRVKKKSSKSKSGKGKSKAVVRSDSDIEEVRPSKSSKSGKGKSMATVRPDSDVELPASDNEVTTPTPQPKKRRAHDDTSQPSYRNKKARPHHAQIEAYLNSWALAQGFQPPQLGGPSLQQSGNITHIPLNDSSDEEDY
ncbi:hypothetical protein H0H92_005055 [Tricholoma furcatifolium]|nr:hypothetical protein H0H92_005055 [Tricholoma furcatifolium]